MVFIDYVTKRRHQEAYEALLDAAMEASMQTKPPS